MNVRTRLILIGLSLAAAIFFLWPSINFFMMESEIKSLSGQDSIEWMQKNGADYLDAKQANRLKLGLDLQGGIYITMELDIPALLYESAQRESVDDLFEQVITQTREEAARSDDPVIEIFQKHFDAIARPQGRTLLHYYDFGTISDPTEQAVVQKLTDNIDDAVDQAEEVIRQRIDKFGVSEVTLQKVGGRRLVLELPGVTNEEEVRDLLQTTARLEFKVVKSGADVARTFRRIDDMLAKREDALPDADTTTDAADTTDADTTADGDTTDVADADTTGDAGGDTTGGNVADADTNAGDADSNNPYSGLPPEEQQKKFLANHPLTRFLETSWQPSIDDYQQRQQFVYEGDQFPEGVYSMMVLETSIDSIKAIMARPEVKAIWPEDLLLAFGASPLGTTEDGVRFYNAFVLQRDAELTGEVVTDATSDFSQDEPGKRVVRMYMNGEGADQWARITGENINNQVAIVLDSLVYSAPRIESRIAGGVSTITGDFTGEEASLLAVVLKAGALKAPIKIIEERIVGPSLGADSIMQGRNALIGAAVLVIIFMAIYYSFGGIIADLAVLMNLFLVIGVLSALGATLTLPGIAGLVLTLGMAVDGNILIYERIREELASGKPLKRAVDLGYEKAFSAIIDSNVTTFITGAILYVFGSGPIRGFAITLMIGIVMTLFTAVFVTHTAYLWQLGRGATNINFGQPKRRSDEKPVTA